MYRLGVLFWYLFEPKRFLYFLNEKNKTMWTRVAYDVTEAATDLDYEKGLSYYDVAVMVYEKHEGSNKPNAEAIVMYLSTIDIQETTCFSIVNQATKYVLTYRYILHTRRYSTKKWSKEFIIDAFNSND